MVWAAPGALETLPNGGGVPGPRAAHTPKMADFQSLKKSRILGQAKLSGSLEGGEFRIPNCHEMALELVCGADFWCTRHCRMSPVVLEGFWGQVWPKIGRKPRKTKISEFRITNEPLRANVQQRGWPD